jgi:gamma-glutamylcyclotransferase (GGCT)/AIG2-like uncharacterized protein YtfP
MNVFTYGSLMFPQVWEAVIERMFPTIEGAASGFEVFRVKDAVFPGIIETAERSVRGVIYLDVDPDSVKRLDTFEDDFYERQTIWIDCDGGQQLEADAYVVPEANRSVLTDEIWDRDEFVASGGLQDFINRFAGFRRVADEETI